MLKKMTSYLATDFGRHENGIESEMALTEDSVCGSTWSEQAGEEMSCSTAAVFSGAKKHSRVAKLDKQRQQRSRPLPPPPSVDRGLEDGQQSVVSIRSESSKPRRQQWSAMWFVQMSVVVVALAVAISIALVFALRDSEDQARDGDRRSEDDGGDVLVADDKNSFEAGTIRFESAHFKKRGPEAIERTETARVEQPVGSASASARSRGPSMSEPKRTGSSFPAGVDGVIWLEDGTFGYVLPKEDQRPPMGGVDEFDDGRRRHSVPSDGKRVSVVAKSTVNPSSPSVGRGGDKMASAAKSDRHLPRFNKKAVARKQELRWLLST
ncbi:hypothetical protein MTO96_040186 [Rhipicephalus appendiculatus]